MSTPSRKNWNASRRTLLKGVGMATVATSLPPVGSALAQGAPTAKGPKLLEMDGKAKLAVLGDKPLVAETQAELLDDAVTPTDKLFVRNNGQVPEATRDPKAWKIKVDGEVNTPLDITLGELQTVFHCAGLPYRDGIRSGFDKTTDREPS